MTKKQLELLTYIREFIIENGYAPSFDEMRAKVGGGSKSVVFRLLGGLEEQGRITRLRNRARAIEIVENPTMPRQLGSFTVSEIAAEAKRRGLVLGHLLADGDGKRTFKEIPA